MDRLKNRSSQEENMFGFEARSTGIGLLGNMYGFRDIG